MTLRFSNEWVYYWVSFSSFSYIFLILNSFHTYSGLDKGESKPEDIEKLKKLVPKPYQKYIESEYK
jgi:hypothetical protein